MVKYKKDGIACSATIATSIQADENSSSWQIALEGAVGTVALSVKSRGTDTEEIVYRSLGVPFVFNLATPETMKINYALSEIILTPESDVLSAFTASITGMV